MVKTIGLKAERMVVLNDADIHQGEKVILSNVNLKLQAGEFCYILGQTGSGKSSLLKTIYGDLPLKKGYGKVADFELTDLDFRNKHLFRRSLGIIFQEYFLFKSWTVYENLDYILRALNWESKSSRDQRIKEVLIDVGLVKKIYNKTFELSGGEQQRVSIARAIINHPNLLIADEPAGNLDEELADELMYLIRDLTQKHRTAVLFATHNERIIKKFPARSYNCKDGKILNIG